MEAGPGPDSAASRADGRTNLQIRFGLFNSKAALLVDAVSNLDAPYAELCFVSEVCCNVRMALHDGVKTRQAS